MELGLSLGDTNNTMKNSTITGQNHGKNKNKNKKMKKGLGFCMSLGFNSNGRVDEEDQEDEDGDESLEKTQKFQEYDSDDDSEDGVQRDNNNNSIIMTPIQLNLLPLAPVTRRSNLPPTLQWSSDNGSSENGSSGNMGLPAVARGFDVNRLPAAAAEEVSSPNSVATSFFMDFGIFGGDVGGNNKRNLESGGANDVVEVERASSRASDEDENGVNTRKKLRLSKEQSAYLEDSFKEHHTLNPKQKLALAKQLNLRPRQVEVWFQNRRARTKLKQTEVDCEYLKRCCETLTEENRRLHKEVQELRVLKTSNPFYMQLPATTLTMCPSCERVVTTSSPAAAAPPTAAVGTTTSGAPPTKTTTTTNPTNTNTSSDCVTKSIPFLSRPRFFPFNTTTHNPNHPHQSAAS